ncbi:methyltransferase/D-alanine--D-alanine ligase [Trypanosoma rangeli]|uniref:Methyltransferase/D-alanine--D-alanine ligase n=1 Tax=Trypanosoma rangeli TaxID=5698 RepID=A0A3R7MWC4_TRYRA|nr:methyltransferase/D-alanine--D-alanine ligase [Trypanosoma rangeli]RNF12334.1 methyltransferase/D-alanine--D-alanine ligase [Trypanosoma rangeli]|eukprot:RNF12334.1 methyltransferase/D-alanine--D-alanine ligase [Trypanosoma rangeli]
MSSLPIRVCVLVCSYEGSDSELKEHEGELVQTPQHYFTEADSKDVVFTLEFIKKSTAYRQIRQLVKSRAFDVFYNQCDGAIDEDKAGVDVVQALESFNVPFTGAISKYYELSKPEMKRMAHYCAINTAPYAVLESGDDVRKLCAALRFPLIVKHISGYSSVGMDKSCKVHTMDALEERVTRFIEQYQIALVEEFIPGDEVTVLVCADATQPGGIRIFPPVMVQFPAGEDFKHFQLKWETYEGMNWRFVSEDDPALPDMICIAKTSFLHMMGGVGYGRVDIRINRATNTAVFLEINPNCGVMYPYGQEGSADWILRLMPDFKQKEFAKLQIREAIQMHACRQLPFRCVYDPVRAYYLCATRDIPVNSIVFEGEGHLVRLCTKPYVKANWGEVEYNEFLDDAWPVGSEGHYYALWDLRSSDWRAVTHSCDPNVGFCPNRSLNVYALRNIAKGEELTMDCSLFMDDMMPPFTCRCKASTCAGRIRSSIKRGHPSLESCNGTLTHRDGKLIAPLAED